MKKIEKPIVLSHFTLRVFATLVLFVSATLLSSGQKTYPFPFLNPELSFEDRATDLVGRLTLEEKISQMMNASPAISRLEIPEYNWWNECLHGVARAGIATVFPQAIGLGATWDEDLIFKVSTAISDEAIADILFGDYNPAGRLPVTFYKSVTDLPPFEDYNMTNRTYRYFKGEPLYPFGYGLSYTTFAYSKFKIEKNVCIGDTLKVTVNVKNTGKLAGDEVVQLYLSNSGSSYPTPIRTLKAFDRMHLLPGEIKTVSLLIPPDAFSVINDKFEKAVLPGEFIFSVGGKQPKLTGIAKERGILKSVIRLREK